MSAHDVPKGAALIPEGAPFSQEQRAWLSGFLAAVLTAPPPAQSAASPGAAPSAGPPLANNDEAPWHDPGMVMDERMKLADGKALAPRLMAAMAQQDCGQCGYNCADYANALFKRSEERLNLCAPGGKETQRMLKSLAVELDGAVGEIKTAAVAKSDTPSATDSDAAPIGRSRERPTEATFRQRRLLNG